MKKTHPTQNSQEWNDFFFYRSLHKYCQMKFLIINDSKKKRVVTADGLRKKIVPVYKKNQPPKVPLQKFSRSDRWTFIYFFCRSVDNSHFHRQKRSHTRYAKEWDAGWSHNCHVDLPSVYPITGWKSFPQISNQTVFHINFILFLIIQNSPLLPCAWSIPTVTDGTSLRSFCRATFEKIYMKIYSQFLQDPSNDSRKFH